MSVYNNPQTIDNLTKNWRAYCAMRRAAREAKPEATLPDAKPEAKPEATLPEAKPEAKPQTNLSRVVKAEYASEKAAWLSFLTPYRRLAYLDGKVITLFDICMRSVKALGPK